MTPSVASTGPGDSTGPYSNPSDHQRQALSLNFNPLATVDDSSMCTWYHKGCMASDAINYDSHATVPDDCYYARSGCLDKWTPAKNYGCEKGGVATCAEHDNLPAAEQITIHVPGLCTYDYPSPPSPPPPQFPMSINTKTEHISVVVFTTSQPYTEAQETALKNDLAKQYNVDASQIEVSYEKVDSSRRQLSQGRRLSVVYEYKVTIISESPEAAAQLTTQLQSDFATFDLARAILGPNLLTLPVVSTQRRVIALEPPSPPPQPAGLSVGAIVGIVIGVIAGVAIICLIAYCVMKKKSSAKEVAPSY